MTAIEYPAPDALVLVAPRAKAVGDLGRVEPAVEERRAAVLLGGDERVEGATVPEPEEHGHVPEAQVGRRAARGRHNGERARHRPAKLAQRLGGGRRREGEECRGGEPDPHRTASGCWRASAASASMAAACSAVFLLRPTPRPNHRPPIAISDTKRFSWSGPLSSTSV